MEGCVSSTYNWNKILIDKLLLYNAEIWCLDNLGKRWNAIPYDNRDGVWTVFWYGNRKYEFKFKYEEDAVRFALRWK